MIWANKYIGKKWTQEHDCWYWFCKIQSEQFGRDVPNICNIPGDEFKFLRNAMKMIKDRDNYPKWVNTSNPKDGDAVILALRTVPHHIGVVCYIEKELHIVHATDGIGVIISTPSYLKRNYWKIIDYITYGN